MGFRMQLRKQFIETSRGRFSVYVATHQEKPRLVCLHGGPGFDSTYLHILSTSLGSLFELIFVDQRGDGLSACEASQLNTCLDDYAKDAIAIAEHFAASRVRIGLFGHSFGGFVGLKALAQTQILDFGIISNSAVDLIWAEEAEKNIARLKIDPRAGELEQQICDGNGTDDALDEMVALYAPLYFPELPIAQAQELLSQGRSCAATYRNALINIYPEMDLRTDCAKIFQPCLVLGSSKDYVTPWMCQEAMASILVHGSKYCVSDVGHFPWVTKGHEYTQAVADWFATNEKV
jgi:proline iminopeptidase